MPSFPKTSINNLKKFKLDNPTINDSVSGHLLFPTVKIAALYLVSIESYSRGHISVKWKPNPSKTGASLYTTMVSFSIILHFVQKIS